MLTKRISTALVIGALLWGTTPAGAQVSMSAACSPDIPGCASLRFFIEAGGGVQIDQLFIQLLSPGLTFTGGALPTLGTYSAEDSFGPFGGFTTSAGGGTTDAMDFTENGFPFDLLSGDTGTLDLAAAGASDGSQIWFSATGATADGGTFTISSTPEPETVVLIGSGFALLVGVRRRRRPAD